MCYKDNINDQLLLEQKYWVNHILREYIEKDNPSFTYDGESQKRKNKNQVLSHPFYMGLSDEYLNCENGKRIMVVGREAMGFGKINDGTAEYDFIKTIQSDKGKKSTNEPSNSQKWAIAYFNKQVNKSYDELPECYDEIDSNSSSFWNFFRLLKEHNFKSCWNNVDKVYFETTLSYNAEEILSKPYEKDGKYMSLLQREIEFAAPNIVLFVTGEEYFKSIFTALQLEKKVHAPVPEKNDKCLVKIAEIDGIRYYWCDHPQGLTAKGFKKQDILNYIVNKLK